MSIWNNINGVYRETWTSNSNINGVWRQGDVLPLVNGVYRESFLSDIKESDILGFRIVYKLSKEKKHPSYPHLLYNDKIPVDVYKTGDISRSMNENKKGIIFEYKRHEAYEEGIVMYEGNLYAELLNGFVINVGLFDTFTIDDDRVPTTNRSIEIDRLSKLSISIGARVAYQSYGYFMDGWNSIFSTEELLDPTRYPHKELYEDYKHIDYYNILPVHNRLNTYNCMAQIGIARDMTSKDHNMVGSYGLLDHTFYEVRVNNKVKPFVVEIYN